ncbi:MAG: aldehyde dehydrogenase family protein [Acidimicrobiales bacterium]
MAIPASTTGRRFTSTNPARPDVVVGEFVAATPEHVATVVTAAAKAQVDWAGAPARRRATIVGGIAHALARQTRELAALITTEEGKTLAESEGEVAKSIEQFHFASQLAYLSEGSTFPEEEAGTFTFTLRSPLGVVAAITPWNFPLSLPAKKLGPALASGNAVVLKPSPVTAAVGEALVRTCREAGVPEGLVQLVHGDDPAAMEALVGNPGVRAISFTGSDGVGEVIRRRVRPGVRLQFELSGHNGAVVCPDADLRVAARAIAAGSFGLAGQACSATGRALVHREVYPAFRQHIAEAVADYRVGPGDDPATRCGPVATPAQLDRLTGLMAKAEADGTVVARAPGPEGGSGVRSGYFIRPTVFEDLGHDHPLNAGEVFGPLLSLVPVEDVEEALTILARSAFGMVTGIHTKDLSTALAFARRVPSGVVKINRKTTGNGIAPPFGGWKASSSGAFPEGGRQALEFFTETKAVYCGQ